MRKAGLVAILLLGLGIVLTTDLDVITAQVDKTTFTTLAGSSGEMGEILDWPRHQYYHYNGIPFAVWMVSLIVCCPDTENELCDHMTAPGRARLYIPESLTAGFNRLHVLETAGYTLSVGNNVSVAHLEIYYRDETSTSLELVIGHNIAEWSYDRPENQFCLRHRKIEPAYSWTTSIDSGREYQGHLFYASVDLDDKPIEYIELVLDPFICHSRRCGHCGTTWALVATHALTLEAEHE